MAENKNMSYTQPSHNHVTVTKVGVNGGAINETKLDITDLNKVSNIQKIHVQEYSDSETSQNMLGGNGDESSDDDLSTDDMSSDEEVSDGVSVRSQLGGANNDDDDDDDESTTSSVSTTEILGRDPLFLVLSEFLMDEEGNNIVHILSKINKNLSRVAKALEERTSHRHKDRKEEKKKH